MALSPPVSIGTGLAVAGVVLALHAQATPTQADMQGLPSGNTDIDMNERQATWMSVGIVSGISLLAKDPTIFVIGSAMTIAMALSTRHAVWTDSSNALAGGAVGGNVVAGVDANVNQAAEISDTQAYTMYSQDSNQFVSS